MIRQPLPSNECCLALNASRELRDLLGPRLVAVVRKREGLLHTFAIIGADMGITEGWARTLYKRALALYWTFRTKAEPANELEELPVRVQTCCLEQGITTRLQLLEAALNPAQMQRWRAFGKTSYAQVCEWLGLPLKSRPLFCVVSGYVISSEAAKPIGIVKPGATALAVALCAEMSAMSDRLSDLLDPIPPR